MVATPDSLDVRSSYPVPIVAQHNAEIPVVVVYDPLQLPPSLSFSTSGDGTGIESLPLSDVASAAWWRDSGAAALAPYSGEALATLQQVDDATGHPLLAAALQVVNAATTPAAVREFVYSHVAKIWAEAAEGYTLMAGTDTTCAALYDWGARAAQYHDSAAQLVKDQTVLGVLNQTIAGGGTVYSALAAIPQMVEQATSFFLEAFVPGLTVNGGGRIDVVLGGIGSDTILTGAGCDAVLGFEGNDLISTGDGGDRIWGGPGDNRLDGGAGIDTAMYSGLRADYVIAATTEGFTVTRADGVDTLVGIERLKFSDKSLAFDVAGHGGEAYRLYQAAFDRDPDLPGVGFWINSLDAGVPLARVTECFMNSAEYQARYGAPDEGQFLQMMYQNVLHRTPDAEGLAYWAAHLANGDLTRAQVLMCFSESLENQAALVGAWPNGMEFSE